MRVLRENVTFRSCIFLSYQENQLMQSQTCSMDKVVPMSRESIPPWVNDTQYLCRVPGQVLLYADVC